jgi:hypothetical protein
LLKRWNLAMAAVGTSKLAATAAKSVIVRYFIDFM